MYGSDVLEATREVGQAVAVVCSALDPETIGLVDVPEVFDELVAMNKRINGAIVRLAASYEEAGAWKRNGAKSAADDLADKTGTSKSRARRKMETSKRLRHLDKTDAALRDGELSEDQAAEVASGADASPDDEGDLLDSARKEPIHRLRQKSAEARARADADDHERRARQHALRRVKRWLDEEGLYNLLLKVTPEVGAEIDAYLKTLIDRAYADARDRGRFEDYDAYAADVVADLLRGAEIDWHQSDSAPSTTESTDDPDSAPGTHEFDRGDASFNEDDQVESSAQAECDQNTGPSGSPRRPPGPPKRRRRRSNPAIRPDRKVIVNVDLAALNRGHTEGGETCEIAGVGPVPVAVVRAMLADAFVALVIKNGQDIVHVTHLGRQVTAFQRTALEARGYECEVEGCGSTHHLDIDHVTGFVLTEDTRLEDLAWLCRFHHGLKTNKGLILVGPVGRRRLVKRSDAASSAA